MLSLLQPLRDHDADLNGLVLLPLPNFGATGNLKGMVVWTATTVFGVSHPFVTVATGSGDKTVDWVQSFCLLIVAAAATAVWSFAPRRRPNYAALHKRFHLFLRFAVGWTTVSYGMVKAIPLQMPAPSLQRLLKIVRALLANGRARYSIGASRGYEMFAGFAELIGGVFLFIWAPGVRSVNRTHIGVRSTNRTLSGARLGSSVSRPQT